MPGFGCRVAGEFRKVPPEPFRWKKYFQVEKKTDAVAGAAFWVQGLGCRV
jgi:hypothetical protein